MEFNEQGLENVRRALFKLTAKDYVVALLTDDEDTIKEIEDFMASGLYLDSDAGKGILLKCKKEMSIAEKFIKEFLESDSKRIKVDKFKISIWILRLILSVKYDKRLKIKTNEEHEIFLLKMKGASNAFMA